MRTIQIELADNVFQTLDRLSRSPEPNPATLVRVQIERLAAMYQRAGLTPELREHLAASIHEHRTLLQRLAE